MRVNQRLKLERFLSGPSLRTISRSALWIAVVWLAVSPGGNPFAQQQAPIQAVTNEVTYNVGDAIWIRLVASPQPDKSTLDSYSFTVRYAGDVAPVADHLSLRDQRPDGYRLLWNIPPGSRAGRYEIGLEVQASDSSQPTQENPRIASFVVHRQVVEISAIDIRQGGEINQTYYTSGDSIGCGIQIRNVSDRPLTGLRLEFSQRYWPWIVQQTQKVGANISVLQEGLSLKPHSDWHFTSLRCVEAPQVEQPSFRNYAAVVWDHDRKSVLAIAVSPLVFINPPGVTTPHPYPRQFVHTDLESIDTTNYQNFHPEAFGGAIQFDTHHTQFPTGENATVRFTLANPTDQTWNHLSVRVKLRNPDGTASQPQTVADGLDLNPNSAKLSQEAKFQLPPDTNGIFQAVVEITNSTGQLLATNSLELGVNPMPRSVLMFLAHEDDDGTQQGFIRALEENHIPFHMVYYTSADAGSCHWYFQHSCGPAEALNFGGVRMQEARAAMGHLGVPREDIYFLGLPDGGSGKIWYEHPHSTDPYRAVLLASDHAPYEGLFRPNLPYSRDAVIAATKEIIRKFQPEVVFTNHPPAEGHIDHIVNNYFAVKALQELAREGSIPPDLEVRVDGIFNPLGYPATPYHYENDQFYVSGETMARAQEAGWFYQSQVEDGGGGRLRTWKQLQRSEAYRKVLDWKEHEGWNEKQP